MRTLRLTWISTLVLVVGVTAAEASTIVYNQPSLFPGGTVYASQDDPGGFGAFATVYDNFTIAGGATINFVSWQGAYFNGSPPAAISAFTVTFWSNVASAPGLSLLSQNIPGAANETFVGNSGIPVPTYNYEVNLPVGFAALAGTQYWLSIVPTFAPFPQWAWSTGAGGDGVAFQDFFGTRSPLPEDFTFALGTASVPEPGTLVLLATGAATLLRRRLESRQRG